MAFPSIEVLYAPATDAFKADPTNAALFKDTGDIFTSYDGQMRTYYCIQHNDKATAYVIVAWETLEHHLKFLNDKVVYPKLQAAIPAVFDYSRFTLWHIAPTSDPFPALSSPITELATFALKEGKSKAELESLLNELKEAFESRKDAGVISPAWGPIDEKENTYGVVVGWASIEAHVTLAGGDQEIQGLIKKCLEVSDVDLVYLPLTRYEA